MAAALVLLALVLALAHHGSGCSLPPGGCNLTLCQGLSTLKTPTLGSGGNVDVRIGMYFGTPNKNPLVKPIDSRGGPSVNYETFPIIELAYVLPVDTSSITTLAGCCSTCAATDGCWVYQFYASKNWQAITTIFGDVPTKQPINWDNTRQCYLLTGGSDKSSGPRGAPFSGTHEQQINASTAGYPSKWYPPGWVGGLCNGNTSVKDDPHFLGAYGTRFEFNGDIDKTFALISDDKIHINMKLGGYLDDRTVGATILRNGKAIRTWIKELGILWTAPDGSAHSARLVARRGKEQERGQGFIAEMVIDSEAVAVPTESSEVQQHGFVLKALGVTKKGPFDLESFRLAIGDLLEATISLRVAHPLLQRPEEAYAHFNIDLEHLAATESVHGVLGQTFRSQPVQYLKAFQYKILSSLLGEPIHADGETGAGFLDGQPGDYETSDVLSPAFRYSAYKA